MLDLFTHLTSCYLQGMIAKKKKFTYKLNYEIVCKLLFFQVAYIPVDNYQLIIQEP